MKPQYSKPRHSQLRLPVIGLQLLITTGQSIQNNSSGLYEYCVTSFFVTRCKPNDSHGGKAQISVYAVTAPRVPQPQHTTFVCRIEFRSVALITMSRSLILLLRGTTVIIFSVEATSQPLFMHFSIAMSVLHEASQPNP